VRAFRAWLKEEAAAVDWSKCVTHAADSRPAAGSSATRRIVRTESLLRPFDRRSGEETILDATALFAMIGCRA